jgi:uncharacterized RDD family membrane protein YckC
MSQEYETIACPRCGRGNSVNIHICNNCGLQMGGACPNCGAANDRSSHYCGTCGHDLVPPVELTAAPEPTAAPAHTPMAQNVTPPMPTQAASVSCPRCHVVNEPQSQFCDNCGLPLSGEAGFSAASVGGGVPAFATGRPAGFWIRFVAMLIDGVVMTALVSVLISLFTDSSPNDYFFGTSGSESVDGPDLIGLIIEFFYAPTLIAVWATTVGKRAFSAYVVRPDGSPVSFWRALGREFAKFLSFFTLGIGFIMIGFRSDKRGLHDLIADTVVVAR